jgi:hypothetical protein
MSQLALLPHLTADELTILERAVAFRFNDFLSVTAGGPPWLPTPPETKLSQAEELKVLWSLHTAVAEARAMAEISPV